LNSDSFVAAISEDKWRAELVFGFDEVPPARQDLKPAMRRTIDTVLFQRFDIGIQGSRQGGPQYLWTAEVPLAGQAEARGVARPNLRIEGSCRSPAACQQLIATVNSIRF
jgi:hypothetical protein